MFLTTTEKLNAGPDVLERYQEILEAELAFVKKLRKNLEPVTRVRILGLTHTYRMHSLLTLLRDHTFDPDTGKRGDLSNATKLLDFIRRGKKPLVHLTVSMDRYTIKKHPLAEAFTLQVATD